jgi:hypothetical protein
MSTASGYDFVNKREGIFPSNAPRFSKEYYFFGTFPGFARSSFW